MLTLICYGLTLLAFAGLSLPLVRFVIFLADEARKVLHQAGIDLVELSVRVNHADIDNQRERVKLEFWQEFADLKLKQQRQALLIDAGKHE